MRQYLRQLFMILMKPYLPPPSIARIQFISMILCQVHIVKHQAPCSYHDHIQAIDLKLLFFLWLALYVWAHYT